MLRRPSALGFALLLTLLAQLHVATSADAASVGRQCRRACRGDIAACVAARGRSPACRKRTLERRRREGGTGCQGGVGRPLRAPRPKAPNFLPALDPFRR